MRNTLRMAALAAVLTMASSLADWLQYLGPNHDATSPETGLARSWPEAGPEVLWRAALGKGFGGAAVSQGKVYVQARHEDLQDVLVCLDLSTGRELWRHADEAPGTNRFPGARCVPTIDGNRVYACGAFGGLVCVDTQTQQTVWKADYWKDFGGEKLPQWALGQNPLLYRDSIIVAAQTPKAGLVCFDKLEGTVRWTSPPLPGRVGYVSPIVITIAGQDQIVMISAGPTRSDLFGGRRKKRPTPPPDTTEKIPGVVVGIDPATGSTLWTYKGWQCQTPVPNVTPIGDGRLFISGAYKAGSAVIRVERKGDTFAVSELYTTQEFGTHVHPPIFYEGHLYGQCTTNTGRTDGMVCMDVDGNVKWKTRREPAFDKGGMLLADGLILTVDGKQGLLYLLEPSPEGFKALASAKVLNTQQCWAPLALTGGKLLIRDQAELVCVNVR